MPEISLETLSLYKVFLVYLAGLATSLTPCVYPIMPVVIGYLGNQKGSFLKRSLSTIFYVLGLSTVYTILGVVSALTGDMFGSLTTNAYFYLGFGVFLLFMGGNMMDWYQIPLPQFLQPKAGTGEKKTSLLGAFLVGASSGLVASPCTAPVLGSLLVFIAQEKAVFSGGLLMFVFSIGMCTLIIPIGMSLGLMNKLPRSGMWMVRIKQILAGIILIGGLYFVFKAGEIGF